MNRLFILMLWLWGLGSLLLVVVSLADLVFARRWRSFPLRFAYCFVWPLALFSAKGRAQLFAVFRPTQETK